MIHQLLKSPGICALLRPLFSFQLLLPALLHAARWALVLFDIISLGRCYLYALSVVPPFADVTPNPELISAVIFTTATAECFAMFIDILLTTLFRKFGVAFHLSIIGSLEQRDIKLIGTLKLQEDVRVICQVQLSYVIRRSFPQNLIRRWYENRQQTRITSFNLIPRNSLHEPEEKTLPRKFI